MVFGIYCRKSIVSDHGESVENQALMCKEYIMSKFGQSNEIIIYEDEGFSGKNTSRPEFKRMIEDIRTHKLDYVICYRLDRISRSVSDFSTLIEMMGKYKTELICIKEEFDTSRPVGKAMMYMASVFAQLERETTGERVRDNMLMLAKGGRWLGGNAPLGYKTIRKEYKAENGKSKYACYLIEGKELWIAEKIFEYYIKCESVPGTVESINKEGITTINDKKFTDYAVRYILKNPVYCKADQVAFDYFSNLNIEVYGEPCEFGLISYNKNGFDKTVISVGKHKPILNGSQWVTVQRMLSKNNRFNIAGDKFPLASGIILCGICGGKMQAIKRSDKINYDYICQNKRKNHSCCCKNLNGKRADEEILRYLNNDNDIYENRKRIRSDLLIMWNGEELIIKQYTH